jgi:hypothetical protein
MEEVWRGGMVLHVTSVFDSDASESSYVFWETGYPD